MYSSRFLLALPMLGLALIFGAPLVHAAAPTVTPVTIASSNASTTLAKVGDTITVTFTTSEIPLIAPTATIATQTAVVSGSGVGPYTAVYQMASGDATAASVAFALTVGDATAEATTTATATTDSSFVRFDKTAPTLNSAVWADTNSSTNIDAGDTLTLTWSEAVAASSLTSGNVNTKLPITGHTYGTTPGISWNTGSTVLTLTLGTGATIVHSDVVTSIMTDSAGNADGTVGGTLAARTLADNVAPASPTGLASAYFLTSTSVTLASAGSSQIRYTVDGSAIGSCSAGTAYSEALTFAALTTLKAAGCDAAGNKSATVTAVYTPAPGGSGSAASGSTVTITTPAATTVTPTATTPEMVVSDEMTPDVQVSGSTPAVAPTVAVPAWSGKDLTLRSVHADVQLLQHYLNLHGYAVAATGSGSVGHETTYFGALTKAALAKFQKAVGIKPASGYFGPITRAYVTAHP